MAFYESAILLGLAFSLLAMGIFISMRIFNIPDITTDGSFTFGAAITAILITGGTSPWISLLFAFSAGVLAGLCMALIHTKLKVNALLSGILVMTALYSVNLAVMGRSNIPLIHTASVFDSFDFAGSGNSTLVTLLFFSISVMLVLSWLLRTDFGLAMRATGNNPQMIRSLGVNPDTMKIAGIAISNGLIAMSGFLITQVQGFADINMGIGIVILGLGSVMIGETFLRLLKIRSITLQLLAVIAGSLLFRLILALALTTGIDPVYLKLIVAILVLLIISIPNLRRTND